MPVKLSLDWNQALLPAVAKRLLELAKGDIADLSHTLVIVPTVQSGRRLREALALQLAPRNRGCLPPEILAPETLLSRELKVGTVAGDEAVLAAWSQALEQIRIEDYDTLFPVAPERSSAWQLGMAQRLIRLRGELGEAGLCFEQVADRTADSPHEPRRWQQLAQLERLYLRMLKDAGFLDPLFERRRIAGEFTLPGHLEHVILAATPFPQTLVTDALQQLDKSIEIQVWTYGPEDCFDAWGRPLNEVWQNRPMLLEDWTCHLATQADPKSCAQALRKHLDKAEPESVALGIADPELNPYVGDALAAAGIESYDPGGKALHLGETGRLAELVCLLVEDASTTQIRHLLQHPDIWLWLEPKLHGPCTQGKLLGRLDRVFEKHLAPDLAALRNFASRSPADAELKTALDALGKQLNEIRQAPRFSEGLAEALKTIYAVKTLDSDQEPDNEWQEGAKALRGLIDRIRVLDTEFPTITKGFTQAVFRHQLKQAVIHPDRPHHAHDLLGWLELLWHDAPHLILAGFNEGLVPKSVNGDAFLPETLRAHLGIRTNIDRFTEDAYQLEAICRRRAGDKGRIDILIPQNKGDGTPLKPSRLLFQGSHDTLLPRTRALFRTPESKHEHSPHSQPWKLAAVAGYTCPKELSVSQIKSYLQCPFRFFLQNIMGMRSQDTESRELSPAAFGTLFHDTVDELRGYKLDRSMTAGELIKKLHRIAEEKLRHRYGSELSFALRLQEVALLSRIEAFCERQVEDIRENGSIEIMNTENSFEFGIEGVTIRGRIDRVDQRANGDIELIDYKTSDSPVSPDKAHLATLGRKEPPEHLPDEAFFEHNGKSYRWTDLQLPLYALSQKKPAGSRPKVAYFNLPKTLDKSGFARWEDFSDSHLTSAEACARAVIRQIKAGIFWPPNPDASTTYDAFAPLFPDGIEHTIEASTFQNYQFADDTGKAESFCP
ncbi:PD-(D/E)XK nuclease family protein [Coraliomargarita parva]|uniref:PD-(D/E)XK nuclease family protein n=1 Tax=Coraliomargarita parva TaxID=3014050 RepID=UPI0022B5C138|nr:PD-(D/E)XK nuclease family protein [Coraliomargarita parva]